MIANSLAQSDWKYAAVTAVFVGISEGYVRTMPRPYKRVRDEVRNARPDDDVWGKIDEVESNAFPLAR